MITLIALFIAGIAGGVLLDTAGDQWKSVRVIKTGSKYVMWDAVPVGLYDIFLLNAAGVPIWKSPTKFRVFANPTR